MTKKKSPHLGIFPEGFRWARFYGQAVGLVIRKNFAELVTISKFNDAVVMIIKGSRIGLAETASNTFFWNNRDFHSIILVRNYFFYKGGQYVKETMGNTN